MPIYVYETVPAKPGGKVQRYEIRQSMTEEALERHPETGEAIRRVISGGAGVLTGKRNAKPARPAGGGHRCGAGCCH